MLGIVEGTIAYSGQNLPNDEEGITVQVVRRRPCHNHGAGKVEAGENDRENGASPFVNCKSQPDAEEGVNLKITRR